MIKKDLSIEFLGVHFENPFCLSSSPVGNCYDITKVRFKYWSNWGCFSPESDEEGQWAFEVFPDGIIKYYAYPRLGRKVLDKDKVQIEVDRVMEFYQNVIWLYRPWTEIIDCQVCDGCSYELIITYKDGRKKKLHGDVGG